MQNSLFSPKGGDYINDFESKLKMDERRKSNIRNSKTLATPGIPSKFGLNKIWNQKKEASIEEEEDCYSSDSLSEEERKKKKKKVILNSYKTNINESLPQSQDITANSLSNRLQERRRQQKIQQQLTTITAKNPS